MKPKTVMLLAVALGCGLIAMLGVQQAIQGNTTPHKVKTERVLVATQNIDTGNRLSPDNVTFKEVPVTSLPDDPIRSEEEYEERAARVPLLEGDIVHMSRLTEKGGFGKSMTIPHGMRVITISVNDTHTASGLLKPGDRVDVLVTFRSQSSRGTAATKTKTLLEYVEVFATDDQTATRLQDGKDSSRTKNVSLLLTPVQVNYVKLAETKGTLSLAWRNRLDDEFVQTKDIDDQLLEELEGTAGVADAPYDDGLVEQVDNSEVQKDQSPDEFLDTVQEEPQPQEPWETEPSKPMWTVFVYNGNEPVAQDFEIPEEAELDAAMTNPSLTDVVRSFWTGGKSAGNTPPAEKVGNIQSLID